MPTVVFDVRANHDTGVSRYGLSLLRAIAPLAAEAGWRLIAVADATQADRARMAAVRHGSRVVIPEEHDGFVRRSQWLRRFLVTEAVDLFYTSHYTVDRACPVPFAFTIHDLTRLRFSGMSYTDASFARRFGAAEFSLLGAELAALGAWDQHQADEELFTRYFRALNLYLASRAAAIITVSRTTEAEIARLLAPDPAKVSLVPCGVDTSVFRRRPPSEIRQVTASARIPGPYLMFVGLTHPNKRFPWLVDQLARARGRFPDSARLVAVGGHAEQVQAAADAARRHGAEDYVIYPGRVSDQELAALYSGSAALVTASINEGNNLPPLEALACGSQVIATSIPPLRETLGSAAFFYPPAAGDQLADLARAAYQGQLPDRASLFAPPTWRLSAEALMEALSRALAVTAGPPTVVDPAADYKADHARRMRA